MSKEEFFKFSQYFKGEQKNPYNHGSNQSIFWNMEKKFSEICKRDDSMMKGYVNKAETYIKNHPGQNNKMTDKKIPIETKAIILYIEDMLQKWMPADLNIIFEY